MEMCIRAAVGASRLRLARLLLTDSLLVGVAGGLLGMAVAGFGTGALGFLLPETMSREIPLDWRVALFAALCSVACSLLFGAAPALAAAGATRPRRSRLRPALAVVQVALSLVLLIGAGLLGRSFVNLLGVNPGFDARNVIQANVALSKRMYGPERQREYFTRALAAAAALPGVNQVAVTSTPPLGGYSTMADLLKPEGGPEPNGLINVTSVSAGFLRLLRIPLLAGRAILESDQEGAPPVAVLSRSAARLRFGDANPLGRRLWSNRLTAWMTVVGVVGDIHHENLEGAPAPEVYVPYQQHPSDWMSVVARIAGGQQAASLGQALQQLDRDQAVFGVVPMDDLLSGSMAERRARMLLLGAFALLAVTVALVGIYGAAAYSARQRTHEIGIRIALGARTLDVLRLVVGDGMQLALAGAAIGVGLALASARIMTSFLFGVGTLDAATYAALTLALVAAAALASYLPARRAARINPVRALRCE
jgi:predicted permease